MAACASAPVPHHHPSSPSPGARDPPTSPGHGTRTIPATACHRPHDGHCGCGGGWVPGCGNCCCRGGGDSGCCCCGGAALRGGLGGCGVPRGDSSSAWASAWTTTSRTGCCHNHGWIRTTTEMSSRGPGRHLLSTRYCHHAILPRPDRNSGYRCDCRSVRESVSH